MKRNSSRTPRDPIFKGTVVVLKVSTSAREVLAKDLLEVYEKTRTPRENCESFSLDIAFRETTRISTLSNHRVDNCVLEHRWGLRNYLCCV